MEDELNPILRAQMEEDKKKIFEIATAYKKFSEEIDNKKNRDEKKVNKVYILSKEFVDFFKNSIKYEESIDLFTENDKNEENLTKFKEKLKDLTLDDIDEILCVEDIKIYGDLQEIQNDISKGFEFVNFNFLDNFGFENFDEFLVNYYKEQNNICIIFDDKSKLLINDDNGKKKYHAIDPPYNKKEMELGITLKRTKTVAFMSNKRSKTKRGKDFLLKHKSKTLKPE